MIDEARWDEFLRDFGDDAPTVVETFLETAPEQVAAVVAARDAGDTAGLAAAAHRLRGGALVVGAGELIRVTGLIESAARDGAVAPGATRVEAVWAATERALRERVA